MFSGVTGNGKWGGDEGDLLLPVLFTLGVTACLVTLQLKYGRGSFHYTVAFFVAF
jgi:cytochrome c biogenesis factor